MFHLLWTDANAYKDISMFTRTLTLWTCFKNVSVSAKICPFSKRVLVATPVRNRALEEVIENEARKDMGAASRN